MISTASEVIRFAGILYLILDVILSPQIHVLKQKGSEPRNQQVFSIKDLG